MRLICTECNAQYEIDAALLPDAGREVQCSSCGHVWFQQKIPQTKPEIAEKTQLAAAPSTAAESENPDVEPQPESPPNPRKIDEKVLEILREEAEFESRQRAREAGTLETQPDLGLAAAAPWPSGSGQKPTISPTQAASDEDQKPVSSAFPDIEDISASLEPVGNTRMGRSNAEFDLPATASERKVSFWTGLAIPVLLAVVLIAPYLMAPQIINALPAAEPFLTGYVNAVDELRIRLASLLGS